MAKVMGVKGVLKKLQKVDKELEKAWERGLKKAGLHLQRESQLIVPVDKGNLKGSAFTRKVGSGKDTDVIVGYTASYALFVHEDLDAQHKPGKTAKFLERPAREQAGKLTNIVADEVEGSQ